MRSVSKTPIIVRGEVDSLSEVTRVQSQMARWMESAFGPLYVVYLFILRRFGLGPLSEDKIEAFNAITDNAETMAENARYWQAATERMMAKAKSVTAKGKSFTPPEWFVWLQRYGVCITPARMKYLRLFLSKATRL